MTEEISQVPEPPRGLPSPWHLTNKERLDKTTPDPEFQCWQKGARSGLAKFFLFEPTPCKQSVSATVTTLKFGVAGLVPFVAMCRVLIYLRNFFRQQSEKSVLLGEYSVWIWGGWREQFPL